MSKYCKILPFFSKVVGVEKKSNPYRLIKEIPVFGSGRITLRVNREYLNVLTNPTVSDDAKVCYERSFPFTS